MMGFGCMNDTGCKHRDWCKDTGACAAALDADAQKLRQLTGEDHGPHFLSEWLPIETARKSDLHILIAGKNGMGIPYVEESYWDVRGHWNGRQLEPPTHWMPMPAPPPW